MGPEVCLENNSHIARGIQQSEAKWKGPTILRHPARRHEIVSRLPHHASEPLSELTSDYFQGCFDPKELYLVQTLSDHFRASLGLPAVPVEAYKAPRPECLLLHALHSFNTRPLRAISPSVNRMALHQANQEKLICESIRCDFSGLAHIPAER